MTSVDEFVRENILTFPSIFPNRSAVLHHALCVIGNGYEWGEDGTVVADFDRPVPLWNKDEKLAELEAELKEDFKNRAIREVVGAALRSDIEHSAKVVEEVEARLHERVPEDILIKQFHPQSHYALLMNIPENVTEDWAEACEEMKDAATKAGWTF